MSGLTDKQRVFVEEYLTCWNATEAAKRAGYSERSAQQIGTENLSKPLIAEAIKARVAEKAMSADEVLVRLAMQARATIEDIGEIDKFGTFSVDLDKAKRTGTLGAIKKLRKVRTGYELELHDQQAALALIGKHHKLFTENLNIGGNADNPLAIQVVPIDYRAAIAPLAPGPMEDSDTPGED